MCFCFAAAGGRREDCWTPRVDGKATAPTAIERERLHRAGEVDPVAQASCLDDHPPPHRSPTLRIQPTPGLTHAPYTRAPSTCPIRPNTAELGLARKAFFEIDKDGSGSIDMEELKKMMRNLGRVSIERHELRGSCEGAAREQLRSS